MMASPLQQFAISGKARHAKPQNLPELWPLSLDVLKVQDAAMLCKRMSEQTCRSLGIELFEDVSQAERFITAAGDQQQRFAIRHKTYGLVGCVAFSRLTRIHVCDMAQLSYWLAEPFRGLGVMSWALSSILAYLKRTGVKHVLAHVYTFNQASRRLLECMGFKPCCEKADKIVRYQRKLA
ncbi:GNAT family N-acetyltransferase [Pseudoalteromonas luteoviolacea]|nr:GNAT family N-acetyltransferase [Pseudoalteromonas luteoviolacea]